MQAPAVQMRARGGEQLQTFDALVTGLVILFASLKNLKLQIDDVLGDPVLT